MMSDILKRGTRITYRYAAGKVVPGRIIRPYAKDMPNWYLCELTDEGTYQGGCHREQIVVTDNRRPR